jgi:hypothetical protein
LPEHDEPRSREAVLEVDMTALGELLEACPAVRGDRREVPDVGADVRVRDTLTYDGCEAAASAVITARRSSSSGIMTSQLPMPV